MVWVCRDWDPLESVEPCNNFRVETTGRALVDRDNDWLRTLDDDEELGNILDCWDHGTDVTDYDWEDAVTIYTDISTERGCGFCGDCFSATLPEDDFECFACGEVVPPPGVDEHHGTQTGWTTVAGRRVRIPAAATHAAIA